MNETIQISRERRNDQRHRLEQFGREDFTTAEMLRLLDYADERDNAYARIRDLEAELKDIHTQIKRLHAATFSPDSEFAFDKYNDENKPVETGLPFREPLAEGREHLTVSGTFQSDKYPTVPAGKVPLSVRDPVAQPFLWQYAQAHRAVKKHGDSEFPRDLENALRNAGYTPPDSDE